MQTISFKFDLQHMVKQTHQSWAITNGGDDMQLLQHVWKGLVFKERRPLTYRDRLNILTLRFWDQKDRSRTRMSCLKVGRILNIPTRTVETYLRRVRLKGND